MTGRQDDYISRIDSLSGDAKAVLFLAMARRTDYNDNRYPTVSLGNATVPLRPERYAAVVAELKETGHLQPAGGDAYYVTCHCLGDPAETV